MAEVASAAAARAFVRELVAAGVTDVCITPGSRSTPLTVAFARHPGIRPWLHIDERSASFFALGLARAKGIPVALVCTSGTAAANYYPAVVEANLSRVPLIVCTADRPPRLRDAGADQTIAQVGMFGPNVRWAADLPVPVGLAGEDAAVRASAGRAVRTAMGPLAGPVHLNLPYEEPLIDIAPAPEPYAAPAVLQRPVIAPDREAVRLAAETLRSARRPLLVAGPETGQLPAAEIAALAAALGAPILADPLSGLRQGAHDRSDVLDAYDAFLRDPRADRGRPDAVVWFGGVPTSKALNTYLTGSRGIPHVFCDAWGSVRDPSALATHVISGDARLTALALAELSHPATAEPGWREGWLARDRRARAAMRAAAEGFSEPFEGRVVTELQGALPEGASIVVGNSMPIRDLDAFLTASERTAEFIGNRGANGIDGVVSTALGVAAGRGHAYLVIGDLSFYHDMNGLWAAKRHGLDLTVVLVNNDGGGIFHYLPQAAHSDVFEAWFGTPASLDFSLATRMYGGAHTVAEEWGAFREAIRPAPGAGLRVVEVRTDRTRNAAMHREAWALAGEAAWGAGTPK